MASNPEDIAASLSQEEIPVRLRCASCSRLAVNAFRLPCCDQNICDSCQESLPDSCPVCMHSPLSASHCNPSKSLRLTIRAFLKSEEKKRSKDKTESAASGPAASTSSVAPESAPPVASVNTPIPSIETPLDLDATQTVAEQDTATGATTADDPEAEPEQKPAKDRRSASSSVEITLESPTAAAAASQSSHKGFGEPAYVRQYSSHGPPSRPASRAGGVGMPSTPTNQFQGYGNQFQQPNQAANFAGWNFARMNQMPMQTNMNATNFNNFPMGGMSEMGMNFMAMASAMMPGFSGQGMGMNAMNSMQNRNGFGVGMSREGNFDNFGASSSSMGTNDGFGGNFGANAGYYPSSGYNQQMHQPQYSQMHQARYNSNRQNRFNGRGSFRGRGRGRYQQHTQFSRGHGNFQPREVSFTNQGWWPGDGQQMHMNQGITHHESQPHSNAQPQDASSPFDSIPHSEQHDAIQSAVAPAEVNEPNEATPHAHGSQSHADDNETMTSPRGNDEYAVEASEPQPIATFDPSSQDQMASPNAGQRLEHNILGAALLAPRGPAAQFQARGGQDVARGFGSRTYEGRGRFRGRGYGRSDYHMQAHEDPVVSYGTANTGVQGAPTGPRAMRAGPSNSGTGQRGTTSLPYRGGRPHAVQDPASGPNVSEIERQPSRSRSRSRSPARSPARSTSGQRGRYRSRSPGQYDSGFSEENERYTVRQKREADDHRDYARDNDPRSQSRDRSVDSSAHYPSRRRERKSRSSKHGHDRHERRRNHNRSRSPQGGSSDQMPPPRKRSDGNNPPLGERISKRTRQNRSRSRSPTGEPDHGRNRERERSRDNRPRHHRADRDELPDPQPAPAPQREFKIKDRSKRTDLDVQKDLVREANPDIDAQTLEREARNRERMLKEQQRRESLAESRGGKDGQGRKRSFAAVYEDEKEGRRRKERDGRLGYRYGREESGEARTSRVEKEREALRWS